jgi:hypothetical protein
LPQDFFRHGGWAGGEIEHAHLWIPNGSNGRSQQARNERRRNDYRVFTPEKEMAACARAQTAIIALS